MNTSKKARLPASFMVFGLTAIMVLGMLISAEVAPSADTDPPVFSNSKVSPSPETGTTSTFKVDVTDDVSVNMSSVALNYMGDTDGDYSTVMMSWDSDDTYECSLYIDDHWSSLKYFFSAADTSDNYGKSKEYELEVKDTIPPSLDYDWSDTAGYTGDQFLFYVDASDNIAVTEVEIAYWFGSGTVKYLYPEVSEGGYGQSQYCYDYITIQSNSLDDLHYEITITDGAGNQYGPTNTMDVPIYDNDPPRFSALSVDSTPVTGGTITFSVKVTDNVELDGYSVTLYYKEDKDKGYSSVYMDDAGSDVFKATLDIDVGWTGLHCYVSASDASYNYASSSLSYHYIYDIIPPTIISDGSDGKAFTGDIFKFSFLANDNTYIDRAVVSYWLGHGKKESLSLTVQGKGYGEDQLLSGTIRMPSDSLLDLSYYLEVYDREGNHDMTSTMTVSTEDNDAPFIDDIRNPTASTGEEFRFIVGISDNIDGRTIKEAHILYCYEDDWSKAENLTLEFDPSEILWSSKTITVDINTTGPLTYLITAPDSAGNWMEAYLTQAVWDNDLPDYDWPDYAPSMGTTGDFIPLLIKASDNVRIGSVTVVAEYEDATRIDPLVLAERPLGTFVGFLPLSPYTIADLTYRYVIADTSGNTVETPSRSVQIFDNDAPEIISDMSPKEAGAGSKYIFKVILRDNIEVSTGWVEYWTSYDQTHVRIELTKLAQGLYYHTFDLSFKAGTLYYFFDCMDIFDHKAITTPIKEVRIVDTVSPSISPMEHPSKATTGDPFTVKVRVTDDVGMDRVRLAYTYSDDQGRVSYLNGEKVEDEHLFTIDVRHVLGELTFWIEAWDTVGNPSSTERTTVLVADDDQPVLGPDLSDATATTGDVFRFRTSVSDNIGVSELHVMIELPGSDPINMPLVPNGEYGGSIDVPNDVKGVLSYRFRAVDTSGNIVISERTAVSIIDDEQPIARISGPYQADQHEEVTFSGLGSTDNVGLLTYTWTIDGELYSGPEVTLTFDDAGQVLIELIVSDGTNPPARALHTVTVMDIEPPTIVLNVPNSIGNHQALSLDASGSFDNVGIASYEWMVMLPDYSQLVRTEPAFGVDLKGSMGELSIVLTVKDHKGNTARTSRTVSVVDVLPPTIIEHADMELLTGDLKVIVDLGSTDNVGISQYKWTVEGPRGTSTFFGRELKYHFSVAGTYVVELTLTDSSGNSASDLFNVTVRDPSATTDSDGDGMPDIWEDLHGLDRTADDSGMDPDRDTLSNLEEYRHDTDPLNSDTDGDGLPDDWELLCGFDPVSSDDSSGDPDGDGWSNLDEYIRDMDPNVPNIVKERKDPTFLAVGAVIASIVLLVGGFLAYSRYLARSGHGKE